LSDPYAQLKDDAWRELAEIDARLERGEIDEGRPIQRDRALKRREPHHSLRP
jgi:hypothetical protein